jgi:hypothetical protein
MLARYLEGLASLTPTERLIVTVYAALMAAVLCGAIWLVYESVRVLKAGVFPRPGTHVFSGVIPLHGSAAQRQGLVALVIRIVLVCFIPATFLWLVRQL